MHINIYYRNDLNMRKGKLAAQCAHALMGFWLKAFDFNDGRFFLRGLNYVAYQEWRENPQISLHPVDSEEYLLELHRTSVHHNYLITDQGRTEFSGTPTHTCIAVSSYRAVVGGNSLPRVSASVDETLVSKQILIANRTLKLSKEDVARHGAIASWMILDQLITFGEDSASFEPNSEAMKHWIFGPFAKIMVKAELSELEVLAMSLPKEIASYAQYVRTGAGSDVVAVMALSPQFSKDIDAHTGHLSLY